MPVLTLTKLAYTFLLVLREDTAISLDKTHRNIQYTDECGTQYTACIRSI